MERVLTYNTELVLLALQADGMIMVADVLFDNIDHMVRHYQWFPMYVARCCDVRL